MAPMNKMSKLLNKIERRLGTQMLNLPEQWAKDTWPDKVIDPDTLDTFSYYYPNEMRVIIDKSMRLGNGWYNIDAIIDDNIEIIGVKDIDWASFSQDALTQHEAQGYGIYSVLPTDYSYDDIAAIQMRGDLTSIFINQMFVDYKPPNRVRITGVYQTDITRGFSSFPLTLFIKHATNLMTIEPSKMMTLEDLATADVASFLYENLKYFDGVESVFANTDMKLSELQDKANKRDDIVQKLEEAYVGPSNKNQPIVICV